MAEENRPVNFSYTAGEEEKKKKTLNLASSGPVFSWSPAAQCLTVFLSEDTVFRTTESRSVSLQLTSTPFKKGYNEPLCIYLRTHFYIIVLCHWRIKVSYIVSQRKLHYTEHQSYLLCYQSLPSVTKSTGKLVRIRCGATKLELVCETQIIETYSTRVFVGCRAHMEYDVMLCEMYRRNMPV